MGGVVESVGRYIVAELAPSDVDAKDVDASVNLIEDGIIDSLGIYSIVAFLSEHHGVDISDEDITIENFETLDALDRLVSRMSTQAG